MQFPVEVISLGHGAAFEKRDKREPVRANARGDIRAGELCTGRQKIPECPRFVAYPARRHNARPAYDTGVARPPSSESRL